MIVTGHQPNYLPYAGFFHKMAQADLYVIVDNVQFVKRGPFGWIHRNRIRTEGGEQWLTVPVLTKGKFHQKIQDVQIDNATPWRRKHWKTIEWNYRQAPHFQTYADRLRAVYEKSWTSLCELNIELIRLIADVLGVKTKILRGSELGISGKATELVIDICKKTGADTYLSGMHGRDYLRQELFAKNGTMLVFQDFKPPMYSQCWGGDFVPHLSILDMLCNCGQNTLELLMSQAN